MENDFDSYGYQTCDWVNEETATRCSYYDMSYAYPVTCSDTSPPTPSTSMGDPTGMPTPDGSDDLLMIVSNLVARVETLEGELAALQSCRE